MAVMFLKEERDDEIFMEHFSVPSPAPRSSRSSVVQNRAIVVHEGKEGDDCDGEWTCTRDKGDLTDCTHVKRAKAHLAILNSENPNRLVLSDLEEPDTEVKLNKRKIRLDTHVDCITDTSLQRSMWSDRP